jgi:hypothetical protein
VNLKKVFVAEVDDWIGIYVDEELVFEGHELDNFHMLRLAKEHDFDIDDILTKFYDSEDEEEIAEHLYNSGNFPKNLSGLLVVENNHEDYQTP